MSDISRVILPAMKNIFWYDKPAATWTQALPVGNGRMGAMIFGGTERERIQFNEESLWTGCPRSYARKGANAYLGEIRKLLAEGKQEEAEALGMREFMSDPLTQETYQSFGDLYLDFPNGNVANYRRELDLANGECVTRYSLDGTDLTRTVFASYPDNLVVIHIHAAGKRFGFRLSFDSLHAGYSVAGGVDCLDLGLNVENGVIEGAARVRVVSDGTVDVVDDHLTVEAAGYTTLLLGAATTFTDFASVDGDAAARLDAVFEAVGDTAFEELQRRHCDDYQALYRSFALDFGDDILPDLPMDARIAAFADNPADPVLIALYVQYARYLMIASSRPGTSPANLQGVWNASNTPPWDSKYTTNINLEMNYWPVEVCALSDCHQPLFDLIEDCAITGRATAREHYDCSGWVLHHNTDIWRGTAPINASNHGIWVTGGAWLALHMWEHFLFTRDEAFLRNRAWPVMKGAARFFTEFLVEDPRSGRLISTPSNSPENGGLVAGPTMDHQIIRALFTACIESVRILNLDAEFADELSRLRERIAPNTVGRLGQLQEWLEDIDDPDNHHRHVSHMWGLYPGNEINHESTPELLRAARQSLAYRGDDGTGWSLSWKVCLWARLRDAAHAYELFKLVFRAAPEGDAARLSGGGSYPNLFCAHPPFQIDGNFGAAAGIVEMLIQSHLGTIDLLPALPEPLGTGSIRGVRARGGFTLDFSWNNGVLRNVTVFSEQGGSCRLRAGDKLAEIELGAGEKAILNGDLVPAC